MVREPHAMSLVAIVVDFISWELVGHVYDVLIIRFMCVDMSFLCYFAIPLCCFTYVNCDDVCSMSY